MSLRVAGQASDFTTDPNIILLNYIKDTSYWTNAESEAPNNNLVNFATNFGGGTFGDSVASNMAKVNHVIVRPTTTRIARATIGNNRYRYNDFHDIFIISTGPSCLDKLWKMEKKVLNRLVPNPTGLSGGVQIQLITQITRLPVGTKLGHLTVDGSHIVASQVIVNLLYDKVVV